MSDQKNNTGSSNSGYWNSGNWNSGDWNSGHRNSGDWNSGYWNSGYGNSGHRNSGDRNSGYGNSGHRNSGDRNSGHRNSGDWNSGDRNSGYGNSGHRNSGDRNSGNWNSGSRNSGCFNTNEPKMRLFNQESDFTRSEMYEKGLLPHGNEFHLTKWIPEDEMTDEQKIQDKDFKVKGGTLITYTYKEAWANFWRDTDESNRQKFLNLPNFDADIFLEITGIDVLKKASCDGKIVEIDGKKYKLSEV